MSSTPFLPNHILETLHSKECIQNKILLLMYHGKIDYCEFMNNIYIIFTVIYSLINIYNIEKIYEKWEFTKIYNLTSYWPIRINLSDIACIIKNSNIKIKNNNEFLSNDKMLQIKHIIINLIKKSWPIIPKCNRRSDDYIKNYLKYFLSQDLNICCS